MTDIQNKLAVLARVGKAFGAENVTWAVGGSAMLYFHGKTDAFHDLDLMTTDEDAPRAGAILSRLGKEIPKDLLPQYRTRYMHAFCVDGVDIDLMAGLVIVYQGEARDRSLDPADIEEYRMVDGVKIPLHSITIWRENYRLMGREAKVQMIDKP